MQRSRHELILPGTANPQHSPLWNPDAEKAFLAAVLANNEVYWKVVEFLKPDHFYDALHGRIYDAIEMLIGKGVIANPVTLKRLFDQDGALADVGGAKYLVELAGAVVTVLNADDYARVVFEMYQRRRIEGLGQRLVEEAALEILDRPPATIIEDAERLLAAIAEGDGSKTSLIPLDKAMNLALEEIDAAWKLGYGGLSTGFGAFNRKTGGLFKTDLIIMAGRPGMGKTTLGVNVGVNVGASMLVARAAEQPSGAVLVFSHEMSNTQIAKKVIAGRSGVSVHRMRTGSINEIDRELIGNAARELGEMPVFVEDATNLSPGQVLSRARRIQRRYGLVLVLIDYLQLMKADGDRFANNKTQEVTEISKGLKRVAKELDVPVVALAQLSRAVEGRDDKRPQLSDLRESGAIEQDADVVLFLYREEYYLKNAEPKQRANENGDKFHERLIDWQARLEQVHNICEVIIAKQRHGPIGGFRLQFDGASDTFREIEGE